MKEFNLEEYLKNPDKKVVTRGGMPVRIICIDREDECSIVALVKEKTGTEVLCSYNTRGEFWPDKCSDFDLMFTSTKKEGWVNLFKNNSAIITGEVYNTEEEAKSAILCKYIYISTTKIEWEE